MNGLTSGTQALQGRTVNHDPEPYISEQGTRQPWSMLGVCEYAPRPEYDVLDNPILAAFRDYVYYNSWHNEAVPLAKFAREFLSLGLRGAAVWNDAPPEQVDHARRVLTKLAALA